MKTKLISGLIVALVALQCTEPGPLPIVDHDITLQVVDIAGKNLLQPDMPGSLNTSDIRVFYLEQGVRKEIYNPLMDMSRNYRIYRNRDKGPYLMMLMPYTGTSMNEETTTIIHWNDNIKEDTLQCQIYKHGSGVYARTVKINGIQKYTYPVNQPVIFDSVTYRRFVTVIK